MTVTAYKPPFVDRETIHAKLMLFGSVVGLMEDRSENFDSEDYYALQSLLYDAAKAVWPEWKEEPEEGSQGATAAGGRGYRP